MFCYGKPQLLLIFFSFTGSLRACGQCGLISERNTELALEMIESRNLTSHMYKEEIATIVRGGAQEYYAMMIAILEKAKPENVKSN